MEKQEIKTITTAPGDLVKIEILQRRHDFIEAFELYKKQRIQGIDPETHIISSRLQSLYVELEPFLEEKIEAKVFSKLSEQVDSEKFDDIEAAFKIINKQIYKVKLTKFDLKKDFDREDLEQDDKAHGL